MYVYGGEKDWQAKGGGEGGKEAVSEGGALNVKTGAVLPLCLQTPALIAAAYLSGTCLCPTLHTWASPAPRLRSEIHHANVWRPFSYTYSYAAHICCFIILPACVARLGLWGSEKKIEEQVGDLMMDQAKPSQKIPDDNREAPNGELGWVVYSSAFA